MGKGRFVKERKRASRLFWEEYEGPMICHYCYCNVYRGLPDAHPQLATIEHVRPLSRGGKSKIKNLVLACHACNQKRARIYADGIRDSASQEQRKAARIARMAKVHPVLGGEWRA